MKNRKSYPELGDDSFLLFIDRVEFYINLKYDGDYLRDVKLKLKNIKPLWYFASEEFIKISKILLLSENDDPNKDSPTNINQNVQ